MPALRTQEEGRPLPRKKPNKSLPLLLFGLVVLGVGLLYWKLESNARRSAQRELEAVSARFENTLKRRLRERALLLAELRTRWSPLLSADAAGVHLPKPLLDRLHGDFHTVMRVRNGRPGPILFQEEPLPPLKGILFQQATHQPDGIGIELWGAEKEDAPQVLLFLQDSDKKPGNGFLAVCTPQVWEGSLLSNKELSRYHLTLQQGENLVYAQGAPEGGFQPEWSLDKVLLGPGLQVLLRIQPRPEHLKQFQSPVPRIILFFGFGVGVLLGLLTYGLQSLRSSNQRLRQAELQMATLNRQLSASNERLLDFMDSTDAIITIWNARLHLAEINRAGTALVGPNDRRELLGKPLEFFAGRLFNPEHRDAFALALENKETLEWTEEILHPRLGVRFYKTKAFPVGTGLGVISQDMTELFQANRKLRQKNHELEQFVYVASHDLQEPLNTVLGMVDVLQEELADNLPPSAASCFGFMRDSCLRMKKLIAGLLEHSKIGRRQCSKEVALHQLVGEVLIDLAGSLAQADAVVEVEELPRVWGYELELKQLFQNLLSNALKYRKPGVPPRIRVTCRQQATGWKFGVHDNGIGIEPEACTKVFGLFQRLHARGSYEGTGIGLAHCKKIVELHNGTIWVESLPGCGSSFYFTLPHRKPGNAHQPEDVRPMEKPPPEEAPNRQRA
ncbi:MAG: hypothetical protein D6765_15810 [Bacteroidetes bacterium]|nr:MAG: hypothetical protein D6765_15810 [Bacteroidota bacterium]